MSSDKSAKNTGTRHKARECALHMLFAYDLVRPPKYSLSDYWGELGLEELHKGMTALIWSFTDEAAKIERAVSEFRSFFKRLEPLEKSTSRTDKLKSITNHIEHLDRDYRAFVRAIERNGPFDDQEIRRGVRSIRNAFDALKTTSRVLSRPSGSRPSAKTGSSSRICSVRPSPASTNSTPRSSPRSRKRSS